MTRDDKRLTVAVVNFKGGTGKTTTAVFLAHALHEQGRRVLLVDADPQGSALGWYEDAPEPFPFSVVALPSRDIDRQLRDVVSPEIDAIVIDTPPLDQKSGVVFGALRTADFAVVPVAPTPMEYKRLGQVVELAADMGSVRASGEPVPLAVLLSRTVAGASSTKVWRDQMATADGLWVLGPEVRRLERFSQAYGDNVTSASATAYGEVATELLRRAK